MRRLQLVMTLAVLLQACSMGAPASTPTATGTPTPADTATPAFTPTITPSPTIVRIPTQDFNQLPPTPFTLQLYIGSVTVTPFSTPGSTRPGPGFASVSVSNPKLYWGGCKYNSTVIAAEVDDPEEVASVIIFTRTKLMKEDDSTPWTSGNVMFNNRDGTFTYKMRGNDVKGTTPTRKSWVIFQLVATNWDGEEVGRTRIYYEEILLGPCMCLDPSTGCPPTAIKPTRTPTP